MVLNIRSFGLDHIHVNTVAMGEIFAFNVMKYKRPSLVQSYREFKCNINQLRLFVWEIDKTDLSQIQWSITYHTIYPCSLMPNVNCDRNELRVVVELMVRK